MVLPNQKTECIWCGGRLVAYWPERWQTCVQRSAEHIIPESIGGRIKTYDLCRNCNSKFGGICDHALVKDQRIITAAEAVGLKLTDLQKGFTGKQKTETGREVQTRYDGGEFKPVRQLRPTADLMVPAEDWERFRPQTRGSLIAKVRRKALRMRQNEIEVEVDKLLSSVDAERDKGHWNDKIGEGFQLTTSSGPVTVSAETFPWETEWCLAKIIFELANVAWPADYQTYYSPVVEFFRQFLAKQEHDSKTKTGNGIFRFTELPDEPTKEHRIVCTLTPTRVEWRVVFFGKAQWGWEIEATPIKAPDGEGWNLTVNNPLTGGDATVEWRPLP